MFEYKVRCRHKLGWKEIKLYADIDIEEFFNRNSIDYVRNMTDTVEHRQFKEIERLKEENRDLSRMCEIYSKSLYNAELTDYKSRNEKAIEYIEDRFFINEETGEYYLTHTFDDSNLYELMKILDKGV